MGRLNGGLNVGGDAIVSNELHCDGLTQLNGNFEAKDIFLIGIFLFCC